MFHEAGVLTMQKKCYVTQVDVMNSSPEQEWRILSKKLISSVYT